ncbi:MAG: efflux RND transporter periplasmic adaptor subunit [Dysgonamonadaceae bacterium]|nr:efflux RND transporter periplasmic adaptor subunit [Dysgonamonadaceae bacterium]
MKQTVILFLLLLMISCGGNDDESVGKVSRETIVETGELAAINNYSFVMQRYGQSWNQMKITGILEQGAIVNAGDSVIQLDPTEVQKFILDNESVLETERANYEKLLVNQEIIRNELLSSLKNEMATFELRKIELESSRFESDRVKRIKELEFKQAEIAYQKELRKQKLQKIIQDNDRKIQEIRLKQVENNVANAKAIIPRLTLRSPVAGVFQISHNWETNKPIKVGDQIYTGNNMANIPEIKYMKVGTSVNETDFLKLRRGQPVEVRMDALKDVVFKGEISYIGKLCYWNNYRGDSKTRQKVFDVEVRILEPDERLKPGMTVNCRFL